jgi:DNA (cytosine-5)-methyltransferase 1
MVELKQIGAFSGIGGFELAGVSVGFKPVLMCEINTWCQNLLQIRFPNVPIHSDFKTLKDHLYEYLPDYNPNEFIFTGGFPCQPFSTAGARGGAKDDRYLWPEVREFLAYARPRWIVLENVAGIASMVLSTWETPVDSQTHHRKESDMVLHRIREDIEEIGYTVQVLNIPAAAVEADHIRERIWIVAHHKGKDDGQDSSR